MTRATYSVRWEETTTRYAFIDADGEAEALESFWLQHHAGSFGHAAPSNVRVTLEDG